MNPMDALLPAVVLIAAAVCAALLGRVVDNRSTSMAHDAVAIALFVLAFGLCFAALLLLAIVIVKASAALYGLVF